MSGAAARPQRADAARNRERVLQAAKAAFSERGLSASVPDIAAAAGVGVATIYRSFPTKRHLIEAAVIDSYAPILATVLKLSSAPGPAFAALSAILVDQVRVAQRDEALKQLFGEVFDLPRVSAMRRQAHDAIDELVARAQAEGDLRPDVTMTDIPILMSGIMNSASSGDPTGAASERHLAIILDGLRADGAHPLPHPPLDRAQHAAAEAQSARALGRRRR